MSKYIKVDEVRSHLLQLADAFEKNDQYYPEKHLKEKAKTLRMLSEKFYDYPSNVEIKHGEWQITDGYPHNVYCSECHKRFAQTHWDVWEDGSLPRNFCPNCGADMRERKETK